MKFSELCGYANTRLTRRSTAALPDRITMADLEVNGVEPVAGNFNGVVVRKWWVGPTPNADKLRVYKVNVSNERRRTSSAARQTAVRAKGHGSHHRRRAAGRFQNQGREAARRAI
ncbi:hypothetical protein MJ561_17600 [Klebsiella pneumoniae]|nr:hypothetical protein MJ561_17600 [Klebsiella pneumoniae]